MNTKNVALYAHFWISNSTQFKVLNSGEYKRGFLSRIERVHCESHPGFASFYKKAQWNETDLIALKFTMGK